jgi:hypothetical protein
MMSIPLDPEGAAAGTEPRGAYFDAMRVLDAALDDALSHIRAEEDAGRITGLQGARERIAALERHVAECIRLRAELGGAS